MYVLICEFCGEIVLPFVRSPKIHKWNATSYVVDNFKCPICENVTFRKQHVRIEQSKGLTDKK